MPICGIGTRTFRNADGSVFIVPPDVEFTPPDGAVEVAMVRDIVIHFPVDDVVTATIELMPSVKTEFKAMPIYWYLFPDYDGNLRRIRKVEFDNGSVLEMPFHWRSRF